MEKAQFYKTIVVVLQIVVFGMDVPIFSGLIFENKAPCFFAIGGALAMN